MRFPPAPRSCHLSSLSLFPPPYPLCVTFLWMCIRLCVYTTCVDSAHVKFCIWLLEMSRIKCLGKNSRKPWKPSLICPHGERGLEPWGGLFKQVGGSAGTLLVISLFLFSVCIRIGSRVRGGTGGRSLWFLHQPSQRSMSHTPLGLRVWCLDGPSSNGRELTVPLTPASQWKLLFDCSCVLLITVVPGVKCAFQLPKQPLAHDHVCLYNPVTSG